MMVSIRNVRPAKDDEWDAIWQACDYATYFHSREWAEVWSIHTEGRVTPDPSIIVFSDGMKALLPLSSSRAYKGLVRNYLSSPGYTFGGWISLDELQTDHAALLADHLLNKGGTILWRMNPYDELISRVKMPASTHEETHVINLNRGFNLIYNGWTKGHKSAATKARREGIVIRQASSFEDWHDYYSVYEDSLKRWGDNASSRYGLKIFEEIYRRSSPNVRLWLAMFEGKIVAGALCFYSKSHVVYWHGAALEDYFHLRPVNLLMYEAIQDACVRECSWFDFNPSGNLDGVKAFKRSFGAESLPSPLLSAETKQVTILKLVLQKVKRIMP